MWQQGAKPLTRHTWVGWSGLVPITTPPRCSSLADSTRPLVRLDVREGGVGERREERGGRRACHQTGGLPPVVGRRRRTTTDSHLHLSPDRWVSRVSSGLGVPPLEGVVNPGGFHADAPGFPWGRVERNRRLLGPWEPDGESGASRKVRTPVGIRRDPGDQVGRPLATTAFRRLPRPSAGGVGDGRGREVVREAEGERAEGLSPRCQSSWPP